MQTAIRPGFGLCSFALELALQITATHKQSLEVRAHGCVHGLRNGTAGHKTRSGHTAIRLSNFGACNYIHPGLAYMYSSMPVIGCEEFGTVYFVTGDW